MRMQGVPRTNAEPKLSQLYERDETAWLERSAALIRAKRIKDLDFRHLQEFLDDMAKRDRREVNSHLRQLLVHLLKWQFQPRRRSRSWRLSIFNQREELGECLASKTLARHAEEVLPEVYGKAVKGAALETGLDQATFPKECPYSMEFLRSDTFPG
jgi:hypothetical protein